MDVLSAVSLHLDHAIDYNSPTFLFLRLPLVHVKTGLSVRLDSFSSCSLNRMYTTEAALSLSALFADDVNPGLALAIVKEIFYLSWKRRTGLGVPTVIKVR